jgi:hypothetical protein
MTLRREAILTLVAVAAFSAPAFAKPKGPAPVILAGCPYPGFQSFCTEMKGRDGTVYNVTGAVPPVPVKTFILLKGTPAGVINLCNGIVLKDIVWRPTRRACPK